MKNFDLAVGMESDLGCKRETNEDSIFFCRPTDLKELNEKGSLAIVADGMGGHQSGEIASRLAVDEIKDRYYKGAIPVEDALKQAFVAANQRIHLASFESAELYGMGTTGTALVIIGDRLCYGHVGDSRLYRIRNKEITLLTQDHTIVQEWVLQGLISEEEARFHPNKNIITRSLGTHSSVEVDTCCDCRVETEDLYLLCSDGLYDLLYDNEIARIIRENSSVDAACGELVALAKQRGGFDNISVIVVNCQESR